MTNEWTLLQSMLPDLAVKLGVALVCGMLLGMERERRDKPAGLRTITLITVGAALFMIVSELIHLVVEGSSDITRVDPSRIASQVVSGIGFLGAGAIIQARGAIHGLTTAAVIWVAAAIGLCVGIGFPMLGLGVTVLVLAALVAMDPIGDWLSRHKTGRTLEIYVPGDQLTYQRVQYVLEQQGVVLRSADVAGHGEETLKVTIRLNKNSTASQRLVEALARVDGVRGVPCESPEV